MSLLLKSLLYFISDQCAESSLKVKMSWSLSVKQEPEDHLDISTFHALSLSLSLSLSHSLSLSVSQLKLEEHTLGVWISTTVAIR